MSKLTVKLTDSGFKLLSAAGELLAEAKTRKAILEARRRFVQASAKVRWPEA